MREVFVSELVKGLLGPRNGSRETFPLDTTPLSEYITGVISPKITESQLESDPDMDAATLDTTESGDEDQTGDDAVKPLSVMSPSLDPKMQPNSFGLSFVIQSLTPEINVCATWGLYVRSNKVWQREPGKSVWKINLRKSNNSLFLDREGQPVQKKNAIISIHAKCKKLSENRLLVNLFFINEISVGDAPPVPENYIFQPQLRVVCSKGTTLFPYGEDIHYDEQEDVDLDYLFKRNKSYARGFLCSAIWKDIDPQRSHKKKYCEPPFVNSDLELLPKGLKEKFSLPDVRTDFIPLVPVESPILSWQEKWGPAPELDAENLSEIWEPARIKSALSPLVNGYTKWLADEELKIKKTNSESGRRLLVAAKHICARIKLGIQLLIENENARISFCMANKSIAVQYQWSSPGRRLQWYPFQLAFILSTIESIANNDSPDRKTCDLLWVSTGAGKTEAYLAITAFTLAYRRRMALQRSNGDLTGVGVGVISRYTLRLLSVQQFRRAVKMITAMETLRIENLFSSKFVGWRPKNCNLSDDFIWGSSRFSAGLWAGSSVTPNKMNDLFIESTFYPGAIKLLAGADGEGEPAQILNCPACNNILSIPKEGLSRGVYDYYLVLQLVKGTNDPSIIRSILDSSSNGIKLTRIVPTIHERRSFITLGLGIEIDKEKASAIEIRSFLENFLIKKLNVGGCEIKVSSASLVRPGYFYLQYVLSNKQIRSHDFEIFCTNPKCPLNQNVHWCEGVPATDQGSTSKIEGPRRIASTKDNLVFRPVQECFQSSHGRLISTRIPIPALTVDEQIYHHPPSLLISTVDKFARLPFEPKCANIFGLVSYYDERFGYYNPFHLHSMASSDNDGHPGGITYIKTKKFHAVSPLDPPSVILQDELHLIEGPLGSMVGIYETVIEDLCNRTSPVKYIASTATVKRAKEQIQSLFSRDLMAFPASVTDINDSFFLSINSSHPLDEERPGRLYLGICAPGKGPLTPLARIWSRLLQCGKNLADSGFTEGLDPYWTITGYFNAIRELAGATALYRQDVQEQIRLLPGNIRELAENNKVELSSRTESTELPEILDTLNRNYPNAPDALFTTSMFGTGIDVSRLGLMIVHGQPKTTSSYIQATGRVGRKSGALVITFFRATRPRDLNHYEFFTSYHASLHRHVEPVTVSPFSKGALDRAAGPVCVALLRNGMQNRLLWSRPTSAPLFSEFRTKAPEILRLPELFEQRAQSQPEFRRPPKGETKNQIESALDTWSIKSKQNPELAYVEYVGCSKAVVLGDPKHEYHHLPRVYNNSPQSMREVEEETKFQV